MASLELLAASSADVTLVRVPRTCNARFETSVLFVISMLSLHHTTAMVGAMEAGRFAIVDVRRTNRRRIGNRLGVLLTAVGRSRCLTVLGIRTEFVQDVFAHTRRSFF